MTDAALVLRARGGCEDAFAQLAKRHRGLIRHIVAEYFPPPGLERDDLSQEAMFGLYKAVRDYRPDRDSGFRNFAEICVRRQVMTTLTIANRRKHSPLNDSRSFSDPVMGPAQTDALSLADVLPDNDQVEPHTVLEHRGDLSTVIRVVKGFTEVERDAVLGIAAGQRYEDIARATGLGLKQIDNAAQRGKRKIRQALEAAA